MINNNTTTNCETSVLFTGGGPTSAGAKVEIDNIQLIPSPFLNITLEKYKTNNIIIGGVMRLQLNGTAVGDSFDDVAAGGGPATSIKQILDIGKKSDCVDIKIECGNTFIDGKGRVISVNANEGKQPTWVNMAGYSIEIEVYENNNEPVVKKDEKSTQQFPGTQNAEVTNITEQFALSVNEDSVNWDSILGVNNDNFKNAGNKHVKVTFSLSVTGQTGGCHDENSSIKYGLEAAEQVILSRIEQLKKMNLSAVSDKPTQLVTILDEYAGGRSFLDFRTIDIDTVENSISINGEVIYRPSGCMPSDVFTTVNVEENVDNDGRTVTISGNAKGIVDIDYTTAIRSADYFNNCQDQGRMGGAASFMNNFNNEDILKQIAAQHFTRQRIIDSCTTSSENNPCPSGSPYPSSSPSASGDLCDVRLISSQIGRNYGEGQINFSFILSNKNNCSIYGAKKVDVEITDDLPRDNIVEILVPGRGDKGVLIQNLCCKSARKRSISINASLTNNLCNYKANNDDIKKLKACAESLLKNLEEESDEDVSCWFIVENQESLGNNTYRLSKQYVKPSCP